MNTITHQQRTLGHRDEWIYDVLVFVVYWNLLFIRAFFIYFVIWNMLWIIPGMALILLRLNDLSSCEMGIQRVLASTTLRVIVEEECCHGFNKLFLPYKLGFAVIHNSYNFYA